MGRVRPIEFFFALDAVWNNGSVSATRMMRNVQTREATAEPKANGIASMTSPDIPKESITRQDLRPAARRIAELEVRNTFFNAVAELLFIWDIVW
jgi:hypothetical protein